MTTRHATYPGIRRATLAIALDNGCIFVGRSPRMLERDLDRWLVNQPHELVRDADAWLAGLPEDRMDTVCAGEETDAKQALHGSPPFTDDLLDRIFAEVC